MNSKEENAELVRKYIEIREDSSMGSHARWAHLKKEKLKELSPLRSSQGISAFSMQAVKCVKSPECPFSVYGYYPQGEMPATDYSNFVIPPLCGEHLLEAAETLDWLLVQALLSLDQKIMNQKIVTRDQYDPSFTKYKWFSRTDNRCWPPKPPGKAKNRME